MSSDIKLVKEQHTLFPDYVWYLAGIIQLKTDLSLQLVINYLKKLYSDIETHRLPSDTRQKIEEDLYQGKIGEAKDTIEAYIAQNRGSKQALEAELEQLMNEMKNLPEFNEKLEPRLEYQSSFTCSLCSEILQVSELAILEDCPHMFHKHCISHILEIQMNADADKICCPVKECRVEVRFQHLEQFIDNRIVKEYQERSVQKVLKSGVFGNVIQCPNNQCKLQFSVDGDEVGCPGCGWTICGKCFKSVDACRCNAIVMKRQCPGCQIWVEKSNERYTKCTQCNNFFCFDCMKKSALCSCVNKP